MEEHLEVKISTHRTSKLAKRTQVLSPRGARGLKMRDKHVCLKTEKTINQSCNVAQHPSMSNVRNVKPGPSKHAAKYPTRRTNCLLSEEEEIIKYMSSLPCYLQHPEKRDGSQNKALNFGVLDWSLLEDWKNNQQHAATRASSSKSNLSFPVSNPSTSSMENRSCSVQQTRADPNMSEFYQSSPSLRANHAKTSAKTSLAFPAKAHVEQTELTGTRTQGMDLISGYMNFDLQKMKKLSDKGAISQYPVFLARKGICASGIKSYDFLSSPEELETQNISSTKKYFSGDSFVTSPQPKGERGDSRASCPDDQFSTLPAIHAGTATNLDGSRLSKGSRPPRESFSDLGSNIHHSRMLSLKELKGFTGSKSAFGLNSRPDKEIPLCGLENELQPANSTSITGRNSMSAGESSSVDCTDLLHKHLGQDKVKEQETEQDTSPIHCSNLCEDRTPRSHSFREGISTRTSTFILPRSDSVKSDTPTHQEDGFPTGQMKTHFTNQFSPLRRMLSPLVKAKSRNHPYPFAALPAQPKREAVPLCQSLLQELSLEAQERCKASRTKLPSNNITTEKACGFLFQQSENSTDSMLNRKPVTLSQHALLQIINKNGIPLFMFSSNDHRDVFAATERKISINRKNTLHWKYTFHAVTSARKKNGWIRQGKKDDKCWRISNVVGQMEATCSLFPHLARDGISESPLMIEYVLSGVRLGDSSHEKSDRKSHVDELLPDTNSGNELAAVIIKTSSEQVKGGVRRDGNSSGVGAAFTETSAYAHYSSHSVPNVLKIESQSCSSVKVILPSGLHGIPARDAGMPSRLIDRWRSGGSCDCGGWDEGCSLTILDNRRSQSKRSLSSSLASRDSDACQQVDLCLQGTQEDALALRFAAVREGLFSIDFDVPISSLQAFSIGIAILHSRDHAITAGMDTKTLLESLLAAQDDRFQMPTRFQRTASVKCIPDPPLSPVGRA